MVADSGWAARIGGQTRRSIGLQSRNDLFSITGATINEGGSVRTPLKSERAGGPFQAVQGDRSGTCVDWQAFHVWQADDPVFTKVVTVLDDDGGQQTMVNWPTPTDRSADISLERMAWRRIGPWAPDGSGRRSATVRRDPWLLD